MTLGPISLIGHFQIEAIDRAPDLRPCLDLYSQLSARGRADLFGRDRPDISRGHGLVSGARRVTTCLGFRTLRPECSA